MSKDLKKQLADLFSGSRGPEPEAEQGEPQKRTRQTKPRPPLDLASDARLQALVDDLPVGYHEIDTLGRITRVNQTELAMLGYTAEEMLGRPCWEFVVEQETSRRATRAKLAKQAPLTTIERTFVRKDGRPVPVLLQDRYLLNANGQIVGIRTTLEDITERKRAEQALQRQNAELAILHQTTLGLLDRLEPESLIEAILTQAAEMAGTTHGYLYVLEPDEQSMVVRVGIGAFADWVGYRLQRGQGVAGRVWETNAPLTVEDYQTWSGKQPGFEWLHAVVGIPLRSGSKVTGVISLGHLEPGKTFDQDAVALLGRFAEMASLTLENARLYTLVQQELEERQQGAIERERRITELATLNDIARELSSALSLDELYQVVYRQVARVLDTTNFFIAAYEEGSDEWTMTFQIESGQPGQVEKHKLGPGLTSYVIRNRQPLMLCDLEQNRSFFDQQKIERVGKQCKSWMGAPLIAAGRLVGVMVIQSYEQENLYSDQDLALFTTIASQAAVAIQNARLFEEARRRNEELAIINSISSALSQSLDLNQILEGALKPVLALTGFEAGLVSLVDPATGRLKLTVEHQLPEVLSSRLRDQGLDGTLCQLVYDRKGTICLTDLSQDPPIDTTGLMKLGLHSYLGIPLESKGQVVGTVCVFGHTARSVPDTTVRSMKAIGQQIGVAIDNANLFEEVRIRAEEMAVLNEISQKLTAQLDVTGVLEEVYRSACRLLDATNFFVGLYDPGNDQISFPFYVSNGQHQEADIIIPASQGKTGHVVHTRKPLLIAENITQWRAEHGVEAFRQQPDALSWLGAPMIVGDRVLGALAVENYTTSRAFDEHDQNLLVALANQAAIAIQNARLFEEAHARAEEMTIASELSQSLATRLTMEEVLEEIYRGVARLLVTDSYFVALYDKEKDELVFTFGASDGEVSRPNTVRSARRGIAGYIVHHRTPVLIKENLDAWRAERGIENVGGRAETALAWIGVPVMSGDQVLAVIGAQSYTVPHTYDEHDLVMLSHVASQAAIAIQNARLFEEARVRAEEMATLNELSRVFSTRLDVDQVLNEVYRGASRLMDTTNFYIALYDLQIDEVSFPLYAEGDHIRPLASRRRGGKGMTEYIIRTRAPLLVEEDVQERMREIGIESIGTESCSWLGVPMIVGDQVIGVTAVQSYTTPRAYNEHHRDLLSAIAAQAAIAIQNARLFQESQSRAQELAMANEIVQAVTRQLDLSQVLETVYQQVRRLVQVDSFIIGLYDRRSNMVSYPLVYDKGQRFEEAPRPLTPTSMIDQVIQGGEPLLLHRSPEEIQAAMTQAEGMGDTTRRSASLIYVPLKQGDEVIGVLSVQSYQFNAYTQNSVELLTRMTNQTVVAMQNARLYDQVRARAEEMTTLNELSRMLSTRLDVSQVLDEVYRGTSQLMDTTNFYVALYDAQEDEVSFALYAEGDRMRRSTSRRRAGQGMTEYVIRSRAPLLLEENVQARLQELGIEFIGAPSESWLGVPMSVGEQVIGVVAVQSYTTPRTYNEHHRDLLSAIAAQAAIAIQNARLFEETRARAEEMTALNDLSRALSSRLDVGQVLDEVHRGVSRLLDTTNFYVGLYDPDRHEVSFALNVTESALDQEITTLPADQGLTGYIIRTRESVLIRENINAWLDQHGMTHVGEPAQSWLGAPMLLGDQVLGVVAIQDYQAPNLYDEHDRDVLMAIASQAAIAIQNARLFEETQRSLSETRSLYEASRQIEASRNLQDMVTAVAEGFAVPGIHWAALLTFERDDAGQIQAVQVQGNWHADSEIAPMPIGTRFSKEMFAASGLVLSDTPTFFDDTQNDRQIDPAQAVVLRQRNMHSLAVLPLGSGKTQTGVLMLAGQAPRHFAERERQAYATLVGQMAVVMENRRLLQETEARAQREQVLREITARVRGSTDPDTIVRSAVRELGTVLGRPVFIRLGSQKQLSRTPGNGDGQTQKGGE